MNWLIDHFTQDFIESQRYMYIVNGLKNTLIITVFAALLGIALGFVLAIIRSCPVHFTVVAKKEVGEIPFLKQVFACMKAFIIDREDLKQSMQVIVNVIREVKAGRNYLIFPEGTRSKNGNYPGPFKGGSFKTATKTKCPIVPVALIDSFKAFDTGSTERITVQVHILPPMYYEEYKDMHTTEIAEEVKRRIEKVIEENI